MIFPLLAVVLASPTLPKACEPPAARDVTGLAELAKKSGAVSVGLDSVATWCFESSGAWTGGHKLKKGETPDPAAIPSGDCAKAIGSCEGAKVVLTDDLRQLLADTLTDIDTPYLGVKYTPKRSGLAERPPEVADCRSKNRSELFAQAQARMDIARLANQAQSEYRNFRTWLYKESLTCAQMVARGETDLTRRGIAIDTPVQKGGGTMQVGGPDSGTGGGVVVTQDAAGTKGQGTGGASAASGGTTAGASSTSTASSGTAAGVGGKGAGAAGTGVAVAAGAGAAAAGASGTGAGTSGSGTGVSGAGSMAAGTGAKGTGAAGAGTSGTATSGTSVAGAGTAGSGAAGTGVAGAGAAGTGTAGAGTSGAGTSGSTSGAGTSGAGAGAAGAGTAGSGTAGAGTAGAGTAGAGTAGAGTASGGAAGTGVAGAGAGGRGAAGTTAAGTGSTGSIGAAVAGSPSVGAAVASVTKDLPLGGPTQERQRALASSMIVKWRYLAEQRARIEPDTDWVSGFLASRELRDCRCQRVEPKALVARLESGDGVAALQADDEKNTRCELCLQDAYAPWKARVQKQCAQMDDFTDYELGVLERSADGSGLPPRCFDASRARRAAKASAKPATAQAGTTAGKGGSAWIITKAPDAPAPVAAGSGSEKPTDYAPIPPREDGHLYYRVFMSRACEAEVEPGPITARTGDLMPVPPGAAALVVKSPCGGLVEVYFGKEEKPRVTEVFAKNQPLRLQFRKP